MSRIQKASPLPVTPQVASGPRAKPADDLAPDVNQRAARETVSGNPVPTQPRPTTAPTLTQRRNAALEHLAQLLEGLPLKVDGK